MDPQQFEEYLLAAYSPQRVPHYGEHYIIQHYAHNRGNYCIVAKSEAAALSMLNMYEKDKNADSIEKICFAEKVEVVPYTKASYLKWAKCKFEMEYSIWLRKILFDVKEIYENTGEVQASFSICQTYDANEWYQDPDLEDKQWILEGHIGCKNCNETKVKFSTEIDTMRLYCKKFPAKLTSKFAETNPSHMITEGHGLKVSEFSLDITQPKLAFNILPSDFSEKVQNKFESFLKARKEKAEASKTIREILHKQRQEKQLQEVKQTVQEFLTDLKHHQEL